MKDLGNETKRTVNSKLSAPVTQLERLLHEETRSHSLFNLHMPSTHSFDCSDKVLSDFSKKNLETLQANGTQSIYQNPQYGSNMALIGLMEMVGFSVKRDSIRIKESLIATLSLGDGKGLTFKLDFRQNCETVLKKRMTSSV